jgi:COMPASS component BRE2
MFQAHNTPVNRNGWRYSPCGPASESLPQTVYRSLECEPRGVHWSWTDRSAFTKLSADAATLCTDKGFRGARANIPVRHGAWYVEVHILEPEPLVPGVGAPGPVPSPMSAGPHVRLGWARREAPLNAPAGFDGYSYGLRGATGERVWLSRPSKYGRAFGPGDAVGMYIRLPPPGDEARPGVETAIRRKRLPIRYRGQLYFESLEYAPTKEMESLWDRSKKGLFRWPASAPSSDDVQAAGPLSSDGAGPSDSSAKRKKKGPAAEKDDAAAEADKGRPLPTLGAAARIGFCINGEPQGMAFDDLFDFRPLKRLSSAAPSKGKKAAAATAATSLTLVDEDASIITSNSSVASIMKSRENHVDDGALGYFPFATSFGGARVRIVADPAEWRFPPPDDLEAQLEARMPAPSGEALAAQAPRWRPYCERYDEYLAEQWELDLADEGRAALKASTMSEAASRLLREEIEEDQRERAMRKKGHNKRKAGGGSATERMRKQAAGRRDESTPDDGRDTTGSPAPFASRAVSSSPPAPGASHDTCDSGTATPAPMDWDADAAAPGEPDGHRMDVDASG